MDRSEDLINQGAKWLMDGGSLDFTGEGENQSAVVLCMDNSNAVAWRECKPGQSLIPQGGHRLVCNKGACYTYQYLAYHTIQRSSYTC